MAAIGGIGMGSMGISAAHATTYTDQLYSYTSETAPYMDFVRGGAPYGTLFIYYSTMQYAGSVLTPTRRKITMKAGSGNGTTDDCVTNQGWLPKSTDNAGTHRLYYPRYEVNHQTSSTVVKGSVWNLGSHICSKDTVTRTELFIHSEGGNGGSWTASNYYSAGCVKIDQGDRSYLANVYNWPVYGASSTTMDVN
jgi:hypothetical protein